MGGGSPSPVRCGRQRFERRAPSLDKSGDGRPPPERGVAQPPHSRSSGAGRTVGDVEILLILLVVGGLLALVLTGGRGRGTSAESRLGDAEAEARRWYDRLGGQVLALTGSDGPS